MRLEKREEWLSIILKSIGHGVIATDDKGLITFMNPVAEGLLDLSQGDVLGKNLAEVFNIIKEGTAAPTENPVMKTLQEGILVDLSNRVLLVRDGGERHIDGSIAPIRDDRGNTDGAVVVFRDKSEHKRADDQRREAKSHYAELYEHARECHAIIDDETGRLMQPNRAMLQVLGYSKEEFEGIHFLEVVDEADREQVAEYHKVRLEERNASENSPIKYDCWIRTKAGEKRHLNIAELRLSSIQGTLVSAIDFTEQEKIKKSMMQSEKLSSLGQLAAGLAHELRNPLAVISSCAQFCLENMHLARPLNENLQIIYRNSQRANKLINELLAFARPSHLEWKEVDINELVTRMLRMAKLETTPFRVSFVPQLQKGLPKIKGDEEKLGQVFLNLILNAVQAVSNKGKIIIQTRFLVPQNQVDVNVIDNGHGIPEDYRDRIFDPFFTTKDGGTGLGLSICHSIVQQHRGNITVESGDQSGTKVSVKLPIIQDGKE